MSNLIMAVLGIETSTIFFHSKINLYHNGDDTPFANITIRDGKTHLKVNPGEVLDHASNVNLGRYG